MNQLLTIIYLFGGFFILVLSYYLILCFLSYIDDLYNK